MGATSLIPAIYWAPIVFGRTAHTWRIMQALTGGWVCWHLKSWAQGARCKAQDAGPTVYVDPVPTRVQTVQFTQALLIHVLSTNGKSHVVDNQQNMGRG